MSAPVAVMAVRDCRACGGGGCAKCGDGVEQVRCYEPEPGFIVRADPVGFAYDREGCGCYEGIKINNGVDQCMHPANRPGFDGNWCEVNSCPLIDALARVRGAA